MTLSLREERPGDEAFLRALVIETVSAELGAAAWPEPTRSLLLEMQYTSRRTSIRSNFPDGQSFLIESDGRDAGWLFVAERDDEVRVVEIMVAAADRRKGVGAAVLRQVLERADRAGKPVRLHVNVLNAGAIRLYERLGFERAGGNDAQHLMEHRPK